MLIRTLETSGSKSVFLTFDDGPCPQSTPRVLDILKKHEALATFFVVAKKAQAHPELLSAIHAQGHSIGNHSLDHTYLPFFQGTRALQSWISESESILRRLVGEPTVGFRPPAGVRTPELFKALDRENQALVLWKVRFFDSVFQWTPSRASRSARRLKGGEIILLHDRQSPKRLNLFLETLELYLRTLKELDFKLMPLPRINPKTASVPREPTTGHPNP